MLKNPQFPVKVLVISMQGSTQRRTRMSAQLDELALDWSFLDAVIGTSLNPLPKEYDASTREKLYGYPMSPGELGCFFSHRLAWTQCSTLGMTCLILEDDTELLPSFPRAMKIALSISPHWDLFRMHGIRDGQTYPIKRFDDLMLLENLQDPSSSAAYLCSPKAALQLLKASESFAVPIDDFLEFRFQHDLRILAIKPYPINAGIGESTITGRKKPTMNVRQKLSRELHRLPLAIKKLVWRIKRRYLDKPAID